MTVKDKDELHHHSTRPGFLIGKDVINEPSNATLKNIERLQANRVKDVLGQRPNFVKSEPKPRSIPDFERLRQLDQQREGMKIRFGPNALNEVFRVKVKDVNNPNRFIEKDISLAQILTSSDGIQLQTVSQLVDQFRRESNTNSVGSQLLLADIGALLLNFWNRFAARGAPGPPGPPGPRGGPFARLGPPRAPDRSGVRPRGDDSKKDDGGDGTTGTTGASTTGATTRPASTALGSPSKTLSSAAVKITSQAAQLLNIPANPKDAGFPGRFISKSIGAQYGKRFADTKIWCDKNRTNAVSPQYPFFSADGRPMAPGQGAAYWDAGQVLDLATRQFSPTLRQAKERVNINPDRPDPNNDAGMDVFPRSMAQQAGLPRQQLGIRFSVPSSSAPQPRRIPTPSGRDQKDPDAVENQNITAPSTLPAIPQERKQQDSGGIVGFSGDQPTPIKFDFDAMGKTLFNQTRATGFSGGIDVTVPLRADESQGVDYYYNQYKSLDMTALQNELNEARSERDTLARSRGLRLSATGPSIENLSAINKDKLAALDRVFNEKKNLKQQKGKGMMFKRRQFSNRWL